MKKIHLELNQSSNKKKIIIFGSSGGLGKSISKIISKKKFILFKLNKKKINFNNKSYKKKINIFLKKNNPDIIINCSGVLGNNLDNYENVFNTNFGSNWEILKYYFINCKRIKKTVKIIMIGSSSYKYGKKDYMLYSASKSALNNLFKSANILLKNSNIKIIIQHPVRMNTKMIKNIAFIKKKGVSPKIIAKKIIRLI
jgi:short-subunit dehydrogenase